MTHPMHMTSFDHAIKIMELHMNGAHSDLNNNLNSEDEDIKMKKKEAVKYQKEERG